jgi:3-oxoacyl-[acyl-carrier-protein] synthase-3
VGAYAPKRILTNADLEKIVATSDEWIVQRSGIRERHIADETEATSDLAVKAAQQALERANLTPDDIDFIVLGTTSADMQFPSTANYVQHKLGCGKTGSVDVWAACTGSIYSLSIGAQYVQTGKYRRVLCIGAETLSRITDWTDRGTCVLLADAAGAVILAPSADERGLIDADLYSDGTHADLLYMPGGGARHPASHETVDARMHYAEMKERGCSRSQCGCSRVRRGHPGRHGFTAADVDLHPHQAPAHHRGGGQAAEPLPMSSS